ncbi:hypothetical protein PYR71_19440 [Rhizobium sp. MC63]|uniref:Uncharacterized protein n=1 Tax=Rhizobium mulingense TaxID=3031128 RepID=A0ACC6N4B8_9HYPH|nr:MULTISPECIES: hypothetical protein [unclassified Rhizobium]MDF0698642.1 hypothetical protein [Rhizobium sp. MC63]MEA3520238.1 hypothetical protein [Rhizobium sp. MJ31]MEB3045373.1 hypothetical protein [Rhizobium sp. MJ21]
MSLLKFFLKPIAGISRTQPTNTPTWEEDPLRHPEVERMSLREIADLPLGAETGFHPQERPALAKCA